MQLTEQGSSTSNLFRRQIYKQCVTKAFCSFFVFHF